MAKGQKYWNRVFCECCKSVRLSLEFGLRLQQRYRCLNCGCVWRVTISNVKRIKCKRV